jgi:Leucine-rich repeat (LRR) protein
LSSLSSSIIQYLINFLLVLVTIWISSHLLLLIANYFISTLFLFLSSIIQISDKASASGIQAINLTRNNLVELKRNIFFNSNLVNLQKISLQKGFYYWNYLSLNSSSNDWILNRICFSIIVGLERIDENAFYSLNNIVDLDLSSNSLNYIPSQSLAHMKRLRSLDLSSNQISSVPKEAFYNLTNLKILSLSRFLFFNFIFLV